MNQLPIISVLMITYNHELYIEEAINSVLSQITEYSFEIVIGEDCSTDNTRKICEELQKKHPDVIRLLPSEKNLGVNANHLRTLNECNGEYIAFLEGDDFWTDDNKLQLQVNFLENNKEYSGCFTSSRYHFEAKSFYEVMRCNKSICSFEDILMHNEVPSQTIVYRKENLKNLPVWFSEILNGDWLIHLINTNISPYYYFDIVTAAYRIHDGGVYSGKSELYRLIKKIDLMEKIINDKYFLIHQKDKTHKKYKNLLLAAINASNGKNKQQFIIKYILKGFRPINLIASFYKNR